MKEKRSISGVGRTLLALILLLAAALLSGCGGEGSRAEGQSSGASEVAADWKTEGFAAAGKVEERQGYWIAEYIPWGHEGVVLEEGEEMTGFLSFYPLTQACGDKIYRLSMVVQPPSIRALRWYLEIYDTASMSSSLQELSPERLGVENITSNGWLAGMAVTGDGGCVFRWMEKESGSDGKYHQTAERMIYLDSEGEVRGTDFWQVYLEKEIEKDALEDVLTMEGGNCVCDGAGNIYHRTGLADDGYGSTDLYVLDREGNILLEYKGPGEQVIEDPLRTEGGELVFPVNDMRKHVYSFLWPDLEAGEMRTLGTVSSSEDKIVRFYGMQGNLIYYENLEGIVTWNIESGVRTLVFHWEKNGLAGRNYQTQLAFREGQPPVLRLYRSSEEGDEDWLAPLSEEPVEEESAIQVADLVGADADGARGSRQVSECASRLSRKDLNRTFLYQTNTSDADAFRTQVLAEVAAGKGPDMLYVSRADMEMLQELGVLADLRELIPQETLEDLWPAVLDMGTLDGKLAGLPVNITAAESLAVSGEVWSEDTWRLEDFIALLEEGRLENLYYPSAHAYLAPLAASNLLIERCLGDSFLIDWEKRECHFEDERFIRFLDLLKGMEQPGGTDDSESWFHGGKSVCTISMSGYDSWYDFGAAADQEGGHYVGFPTEGNCGSYMDSAGMLVVNAKAENMEGIKAFLEYYLGEEIQDLCDAPFSGIYGSAMSVRRVHEEEIEETPEGDFLWRGEKLSVLPDGTTSLHRAIEFMEGCTAAPSPYPELMAIISEELQPYFAGDKTPERAADIIDGRIQMYLSEGE